jgi:predicted ATP-dependent protease
LLQKIATFVAMNQNYQYNPRLRYCNNGAHMSITQLPAAVLRIRIDPATLHFGDTSELLKHPLPWIGQQRAQAGARFGLEMDHKDYNLLVLGEAGSGRSSLLLQLTRAVAASKAVPPDLCYLYYSDAAHEQPLALRLPAGSGRRLRHMLAQLACQEAKSALAQDWHSICESLALAPCEATKLNDYLERLVHDERENGMLKQMKAGEATAKADALAKVLSRMQVNLLVDNSALSGAPVIVEDNLTLHSLFGSVECQVEDGVLKVDFSRIRAGSLHKAHGGFILLTMRDLLADELAWEKLRRFLRSGRLQIEEPGLSLAPIAAVALMPEALQVTVKIILIGSNEHYYALQELDPEFVRHFGAKVDFAESFLATLETRHVSAIFVAHTCNRLGLPHFSAAAVARLIEESHRTVDDQLRQSAIFANIEANVMESAAQCERRAGSQVEAIDIQAVLDARTMRHGYAEQRLQESITDGERLIAVVGEKVGQLNGLTQIDQGHYRFGFPVRVTAQTFAGDDGLLNIEREVEMSGPIHDKGVLVLHGYLSALFAHIAPLALNASLSFEQEYGGVEGDSASCAEFYALLSCLASLPLKQGIAVTGAINLHGEILPVGGINEKIEGYFRTCETAGLDGHQGVLIPRGNQRHLMLAHKVIEAVSKNLFHVYIADHVNEGIELLTGVPAGLAGKSGQYPRDSVLGRAQQTLQAYRRACQAADDGQKPVRKRPHRAKEV